MYKKVLKTMIALVIVFLSGLYVIKIFMPEQFVMMIENKHLIDFGNFVDNNLWLHIILGIITSFITYWLYLGAVTRKWVLNWKEIISVIIICISTQLIYYFLDKDFGNLIPLLSMFCLPLLDNAKLKDVAIVFSFHYLSQFLSLKIRNLILYLTNINYATIFMMTIECYFWLLLFYLYFNLKGDKKND